MIFRVPVGHEVSDKAGKHSISAAGVRWVGVWEALLLRPWTARRRLRRTEPPRRTPGISLGGIKREYEKDGFSRVWRVGLWWQRGRVQRRPKSNYPWDETNCFL